MCSFADCCTDRLYSWQRGRVRYYISCWYQCSANYCFRIRWCWANTVANIYPPCFATRGGAGIGGNGTLHERTHRQASYTVIAAMEDQFHTLFRVVEPEPGQVPIVESPASVSETHNYLRTLLVVGSNQQFSTTGLDGSLTENFSVNFLNYLSHIRISLLTICYILYKALSSRYPNP